MNIGNNDKFILMQLCGLLNILSVSTTTFTVDSEHYTQFYGRRLQADTDGQYRTRREVYGGHHTGYPMYEQQLRTYEKDMKQHNEARNEQVKQYKDYNNQYTETAHENIKTMTASTDSNGKIIKADNPADDKSADDKNADKNADKSTDKDAKTSDKSSSSFIPTSDPQQLEEAVQVKPLVSRSFLDRPADVDPIQKQKLILERQRLIAKNILLNERESRSFLKQDPEMDEGIIMEYLANPAIQ